MGHLARCLVRYHVRDPAEVGAVVRSHFQPQEVLSLHASDLLRVVTCSRPCARLGSPPPVPIGGVFSRTHDVTVEKILVQPHVLPGYLPPPKIPQHAQSVIYVVQPPVVGCARVVGPFAGQKPLPLLREVLDLLHDLTARHRFAFLSGIAAGTDLP